MSLTYRSRSVSLAKAETHLARSRKAGLAVALLLAVPAHAAAFADLDMLDRQVAAFTGAAVGQPGGALLPLDRRLRLQPCVTGVALSWRSANRESVVIQCGDANGWRLFVPVRQSGTDAPAELAVRRGDAVAIAISGEGFTVSQPGEALQSGPVGAWVAVRPAAAGRSVADTIQGQIVRPGLVAVPVP